MTLSNQPRLHNCGLGACPPDERSLYRCRSSGSTTQEANSKGRGILLMPCHASGTSSLLGHYGSCMVSLMHVGQRRGDRMEDIGDHLRLFCYFYRRRAIYPFIDWASSRNHITTRGLLCPHVTLPQLPRGIPLLKRFDQHREGPSRTADNPISLGTSREVRGAGRNQSTSLSRVLIHTTRSALLCAQSKSDHNIT